MGSSVITLLLSGVALVVPGAAVALAARVPLLLSLTAAPVITYGLVTVAGQVAQVTGLSWSPVEFAAVVVAVLVLVWAAAALVGRSGAASLAWPRRGPDEPRTRAPWCTWSDGVLLLAVGVAGALAAVVAVWGMGGLDGINQEFDVLFHVNAVELISQTQNADPSAVGAVNHYDVGTTSYPVAFHALAALVVEGGANAVAATNAMVALIPAVLVAGTTGLLSQLGLRRHAFVAPFVGISIAAFPFDLMWRGPVWPFAMGVAAIPAFLALLVHAFEARSRGAALLVAIGAAGLLAVHPSAALGAGVFALAYFIQRWLTRRPAVVPDLVGLAAVLLATVALALPSVTVALANSGYGAAYDWPAVQTPGWALGEFLTYNYFAPYPQIWLALLLLVGLLTVRRLLRAAWLLAAAAVFTALLVLAAAYEGPLVALLTGPWWNDRFRFTALGVIGLGLLSTHGLVVVAESLHRFIGKRAGSRLNPRPVVPLLVVLAVFGVLTQGFYAQHNRDRLQIKYAMGSGGSVTPDDLAAMDFLRQVSEPGDVVMNDPGDGSAWMWAIYGIRPMFGQAVLNPVTPALEADQEAVFEDFHCLDSDSTVRSVVEEYSVRYVFLSSSYIFPDMSRIQGLQGLAFVDSLELVYSNDGAQVYRVDLAPLVPSSEDDACKVPAGTEN